MDLLCQELLQHVASFVPMECRFALTAVSRSFWEALKHSFFWEGRHWLRLRRVLRDLPLAAEAYWEHYRMYAAGSCWIPPLAESWSLLAHHRQHRILGHFHGAPVSTFNLVLLHREMPCRCSIPWCRVCASHRRVHHAFYEMFPSTNCRRHEANHRVRIDLGQHV